MTNVGRTLFRYLIVAAWLLSGAYFGSLGVVTLDIAERWEQIKAGDPLPVEKQYVFDDEMMMYPGQDKLVAEQLQLNKMPAFRALNHLPEYLLLILASCAFGAMGATMRLVKKEAVDKVKFSVLNAVTFGALGLMVGMFILGVAQVVPAVLQTGEGEIRPVTLVFLSLFAGFFIESFLAWLEQKFNGYLTEKE